MGNTSYNATARSTRALDLGYFSKSIGDTFTQSKVGRVHESMNPNGVMLRECRDSETHPEALPILVALDLTGSMGSIPAHLVKDGLPTLVSKVIQSGIKSPSLMFVGVGDHECDRSPLQVGQFESGDEELDMWLTRTWLEGGGGGNAGESYLLAWYFAAMHTSTDHFEKRNKKGYLFTIGDEPNLNTLPASALKEIMGPGQYQTYTAAELLAKAEEKYNVYHIHLVERRGKTSLNGWKDTLGQNCLVAEKYSDIPNILAEAIITSELLNTPTSNIVEQPEVNSPEVSDSVEEVDSDKTTPML